MKQLPWGAFKINFSGKLLGQTLFLANVQAAGMQLYQKRDLSQVCYEGFSRIFKTATLKIFCKQCLCVFLIGIYLFKVNNGNTRSLWNLFKVNREDTRTTLLTFSWFLHRYLLTDFIHCSCVSVLDFEWTSKYQLVYVTESPIWNP